MIVKEMLEGLKGGVKVYFQDSEGYEICECISHSQGVEPYNDKEVDSWYLVDQTTFGIKRKGLVLRVKMQDAEGENNE